METEKENADGVTVLPLLLETGTCPAAAVRMATAAGHAFLVGLSKCIQNEPHFGEGLGITGEACVLLAPLFG